MDLDKYYQQNNIRDIAYNPTYFNSNYDLQVTTYTEIIYFLVLIELPTNIQPTLNSYFVDNHNTSLSRQQLGNMINRLQSELKNEEKKPTNYMPYILGGIGATLVIAVLAFIFLLGRGSKDKH